MEDLSEARYCLFRDEWLTAVRRNHSALSLEAHSKQVGRDKPSCNRLGVEVKTRSRSKLSTLGGAVSYAQPELGDKWWETSDSVTSELSSTLTKPEPQQAKVGTEHSQNACGVYIAYHDSP